MSYWPDLSQRIEQLELMDLADSCPRQLYRTLEQFGTINRWLTPCRRLLAHHFLPAMKLDRGRRWTLLDLGAGGGDVAVWFSRRCRSLGIDVQITCLDNDWRVVQFARSRCSDLDNIEILQSDALHLDVARQWDFVFANHFLHHLSDSQIRSMLGVIARVARRGFVLSDLRRSYFVYGVYTLLAAFCFRDSFAFFDGRLSIRKGFTDRECRQLVDQVGLGGRAVVQRCFPAHLIIASAPPVESPTVVGPGRR